jgi:hypothetical protein
MGPGVRFFFVLVASFRVIPPLFEEGRMAFVGTPSPADSAGEIFSGLGAQVVNMRSEKASKQILLKKGEEEFILVSGSGDATSQVGVAFRGGY